MKSALPTPAVNYIPGQFSDDPLSSSLAAAVDRMCAQLKADIVGGKDPVSGAFLDGMRSRYVPESCPSGCLDELYALVGGVPLTTDTDAQKRAKITNAISTQTFNSLWTQSVKPAIDSITGASSALFISLVGDDWPIQVQDNTWFNRGYPWSLMSGGGDGYGGIIQTAGATEGIITGIVYIDIGTGASIPASEVAQIIAALTPNMVPAYFRIFLGYTISGAWNGLSGGQIG